ncbi:hypothetical protein EDD21DRAFT_375653 [Dissophora ornata]|nr:hypothetical protein EDD21DRAFT_375653 [Dissophora ornata]
MRSHNKNEFTAKKKSLSIHINTDHVGPHSMPLVYGSTGSIKGSVCFSCNYDCKGRDIQIIYEAWSESHYSVDHKRLNHHQFKEVFGHQVWALPLIHTTHNGSTVVAGVYEKEFEIPLTYVVDRNRNSFDSATSESSRASTSHSISAPTSTSKATTRAVSPVASIKSSPTNESSTSLSSISTPYHQHEGVMLLPSSQYGADTKVRYTIRAVLQRPFPSLSNVEASQEIWVENSAMPPPSPSSSTPSLSYSTVDCDTISTSEQDSPSSESPHSPITVSTAERSAAATLTGYEPSRSGESEIRSHSLTAMPTAPYVANDTALLTPLFLSAILLLESVCGDLAVCGILLLLLHFCPRSRIL